MAESQKTVLVVEDDSEISTLLQFILQREGFNVLLVSDGKQAMRLIDWV